MVVQTRVSRQREASWLWQLRVVGGRQQGQGCLYDADSVSYEVRVRQGLQSRTVESDWQQRRRVRIERKNQAKRETMQEAGEQRVMAASRIRVQQQQQQ